MSNAYPREERARARSAITRLNDLAGLAKQSAERGIILPTDTERAIVQLTKTNERSTQVDALSAFSETLRKQHLDKLTPLAAKEFNAFCEVVSPDEPPASAWHVYLTDLLQDIEADPKMDRFILNVPPGHAKPLHVDTLILMGDGTWKRLGDVKKGDKVITHTGLQRKVLATHQQGELPLLKIITRGGRVIFSAGDHSFRTPGQWVQARDLQPGDPLEIKDRTIRHHDRSGQSEDMFRLAAYYAAGGGFTKARHNKTGRTWHNFQIWGGSDRMAKLQTLCAALGIRSKVNVTHDETGQTVLRMRSHDARAYQDILRLKEKSVDRRLPEWVFQGDDAKVTAYLNVLMECRATTPDATEARVSIRHRSAAYLRDVQKLFNRFDIATDLTFTDEYNHLHIRGRAIETLLRAGLRFPGFAARPFVEKRMLTPSYIEDAVESVTPAGTGECACLTVEMDETFLAEGVVVHNSTYASRLFVAWRLGRNPNLKVIGGGHTQRFVENEFSKKIRGIIRMPEFKAIFPLVGIDATSSAADAWNIAGYNGQYVAKGAGQAVVLDLRCYLGDVAGSGTGGCRAAGGSGGTGLAHIVLGLGAGQAVHGFRANFVVVDDPYSKIEIAESAIEREKIQTWFIGDLGSRLLPFGKMFLIMTRFHENDLSGALMAMNPDLPDHAKWHQVVAPALCNVEDPALDVLGRTLGQPLWDYYDLSYFQTKKSEWSYQRFALVYQQMPDAVNQDSVSGQFRYFKQLPHLTDEALKLEKAEGNVNDSGRPIPNRRRYFRKIILSVDTASKKTERADYTVIQTWGETHDRQYYLLRQTRVKVEFNDMIEAIEKQARLDEVDAILVEDKGQGTAYIQARGRTDFQQRLAPAPLVPIDPKGQSKEFRFDEITPMIAEGVVWLPKDAAWIDGLIKEVGQFPDGAHDDQVDALSQALRYFKTNRRRAGSKKAKSFG